MTAVLIVLLVFFFVAGVLVGYEIGKGVIGAQP
jgi:hypothetical protein